MSRAVQASQYAGVRGYHRRLFASWEDDQPYYLLWDDVDAPPDLCAKATYHLHAITGLGLGKSVRCAEAKASEARAASSSGATSAGGGITTLHCKGLNGVGLDVTIGRPADAARRGLLSLRADPLPIQFTGVSGALDGGPRGGAFGGDWNAEGAVAPENAHWLPRQATWVELKAAASTPTPTEHRTSSGFATRANVGPPVEGSSTHSDTAPDRTCHGFITVLQPRNATERAVEVAVKEGMPGGAATVQVRRGPLATTVYLLGSRTATANETATPFEGYSSQAVAVVIGWANATGQGSVDTGHSRPRSHSAAPGLANMALQHIELIDGMQFHLTLPKLHLALSTTGTVSIQRLGHNQYRFKQLGAAAVMVELVLQWHRALNHPAPVVNVWRGAHVWHITNSTIHDEDAGVRFEALPEEEYLIETRCRWVAQGAGYGQGGWLCDDAA